MLGGGFGVGGERMFTFLASFQSPAIRRKCWIGSPGGMGGLERAVEGGPGRGGWLLSLLWDNGGFRVMTFFYLIKSQIFKESMNK